MNMTGTGMVKHSLGRIYSRRIGIRSIIIYSALALSALLFLPKLTINGTVTEVMLPADNPFLTKSTFYYDVFPIQDAVVICAAFENRQLFTRENLMQLDSISRDLESSGYFASVFSLTGIDRSEFKSPEQEPFLNLENPESIRQAEKRIHAVAILRELFLSTDESAFLLYAQPIAGVDPDEFGKYIDRLRRDWQDAAGVTLSLMGQIPYSYANNRLIIQDLLIVTPLGLLFLLGLFYLFTASASVSLLLFSNSFVPSLLVMGAMGALNKPVDVFTVFLPLLIFSITTAYSIHYYKTNESLGCQPEQTLDAIGKIIIFSAGTTILGFSNLLYIRSSVVRTMGISLTVGILISLFSILFCVPYAVSFMKKGKTHSWEMRLRKSDYPQGRSAARLAALYAVVFLVVCSGLYWYSPQWRYRDASFERYRARTPHAKELALFADHNGIIEAMDIFIDTRQEYGLINLETYRIISGTVDKLRELDETTTIIAYTDIVAYGNGLLYDLQGELVPVSSEEIGETLELITAYGDSIPGNLFVDMEYGKTRMIVQYDISQARNGHEEVLLYEKIIDIVTEEIKAIPGAEVFVSGKPILQRELNIFFLKAFTKATFMFFPVIFFLGWLVLKSWKKGLLLLFPSFLGLLFYLGLSGWLKQPLSMFSMFGIYTLLGISIDDSIYFLMQYTAIEKSHSGRTWQHAVTNVYRITGINILQTTFILTGGLSAALFSGSLSFVFMIFATLCALNFSTLTTLYIMPRFLALAWKQQTPEKLKTLAGNPQNS
ncbi:MAG: MMPL family transporter [Spirochaetia bacterium]|nr:MMPL family transporter [Spirochaetia bacterium]